MLALPLAASIPLLLAAGQRLPVDYQPTTYASPSGAWTVHVDPSHRYAKGPADYRLGRSGDVVWSGRLPFTLREAIVDDEGYVAGYAYTEGFDGREPGDFLVVLLSPEGEVLARHATPREPSRAMHGTPDPKATGLVLNAGEGHFVVRIADADSFRGLERWDVHDARTGEPLASFSPNEFVEPAEDAPWRLAVRALPGTPLYATYGLVSDYDPDPNEHSVRIDVIDAAGRPVASAFHAHELESERRGARHDIWERAAEHGFVDLSDGGFAVWLPRSGERVEYRVYREPDGGTWALDEVGRSPHRPPKDAPVTHPVATDVDLPVIAEVPLGALPPEVGLFREVRAFAFDAEGRLLVVDDADKHATDVRCRVLTQEGEVVLERRLRVTGAREDTRLDWWPLAGGRWVATQDWRDDNFQPHAQAWWADLETGEVTAIQGFALPGIEAVAGTGDGGFVASASYVESSMGMSALASFDAAGRERWRVGGWAFQPRPGEQELLGTDFVAAADDGRIVVVSSVGSHLQFFGPDGTWHRTIQLDEIWEDEPRYPDSVHFDPTGGLIVVDPNLEGPVRRLDADGAVLEKRSLRRADGTEADVMPYRVRVAPDGSVWTTDTHTLMRLGPDGRADHTLGGVPAADALSAIGPIRIDRSGRVVVQDTSTWSLHAFDATGARLFVARPETGEFERASTTMTPLVTDPEGILYAYTSEVPERWVAFSPTGERLGPRSLGGNQVALGPNGERWRYGLDEAERIDGAGNVELRIARKHDNTWTPGVEELDVARDGTVAILHRYSSVGLYGPDGEPLADHPLPDTDPSVWRLCYRGPWILVRGYTGPAWLLDPESGAWFRFERDWMAADDTEVALSPDGRELWGVDPVARKLIRYELPQVTMKGR